MKSGIKALNMFQMMKLK